MNIPSVTSLFAAAALLTAIGVSTSPVLAQETGADIPKNAYQGDTLNTDERDAIAEEENVHPNDGQPSTPAPQDLGVIPDAAPAASAEPGTPAAPTKPGESEAAVVIGDSKKNDKVTHRDISECMGQWDPQSQMTKEEWAASCRTTLQYFPEGQ